jgi:protocatechuate 3,4-dioxygenase beta subunit
VSGRLAVALAGLLAAVALVAGSGSAAAAGESCPADNPPDELVLVGGSGQTAQLGSQFQSPLQVGLAASDGCPVTGNLAGVNIDFVAPGSGASGVFSSTGTGTAVVGTDAQGVASAPMFTANFTAGSYHVDAESDYGTVELSLTNTASGVPAAIASAGGDGQQATVNSEYAQPLQARVTDASGAPVQGAAVTFSVVPGTTGAGASFLGGQGPAVTGSNGVATSPALLANGNPGRFTVVASAGGVTAVAVYSLDNHAASTTITALKTAAPAAEVGTRYRAPLQARVVDASGAPVEGASVTFSIDGAAGGADAAFAGGAGQATELTGADGVATSPPLLANTTAGTFTATADLAGPGGPAVFTLRNRAAAPAAIAAGAASGETAAVWHRFAVPLVVTVTDRYGNPVAGATVVFRAPVRGPSGRFAAGRHGRRVRTVARRTNASGIAVAPRFTANGRAGGYVVTVTARGGSGRAAFALVNVPRR